MTTGTPTSRTLGLTLAAVAVLAVGGCGGQALGRAGLGQSNQLDQVPTRCLPLAGVLSFPVEPLLVSDLARTAPDGVRRIVRVQLFSDLTAARRSVLEQLRTYGFRPVPARRLEPGAGWLGFREPGLGNIAVRLTALPHRSADPVTGVLDLDLPVSAVPSGRRCPAPTG